MSLLFLTLFLLEGMLHLARHERIRILFEDAQTGAGAKVNSLAAIQRAGIIGRVSEFASAGGGRYVGLSCILFHAAILS